MRIAYRDNPSSAALELLDSFRGRPVIAGYAALFNVVAQPLRISLPETLAPGCFKRSLASREDIPCLREHDQSQPLGRRSEGTLRLVEDERGLFFAVYPSHTKHSIELVNNIHTGSITGASFGFRVGINGARTTIKSGQVVRELVDVRLLDVSIVDVPCYQDARAWVLFSGCTPAPY